MSNFYDTIANIQKMYGNGGNNTGPFNSDGKVNYGVAKDIATGLPNQPAAYSKNLADAQLTAMEKANNAIEEKRKAALELASGVLGKPQGIAAGAALGATIGTVVPGAGTIAGTVVGGGAGLAMYGAASLDNATDGKFSKVMMAGTKGLRSNYAFVSDVTKHNSALGLLSVLGIAAAAVGVGAAVIASGGTLGLALGAGAIGGFAAGKSERDIAKSGALDIVNKNLSKSLKNSAILSEGAVGQEKYNFGRDVTHAAAKALGWKTLGDTTKGIGAVTSGLFNFGFESGLAPDVKGMQVAGKVIRKATVGGIQTGTEGALAKGLAKFTNQPEMQAARLAEEVNILKKTAAGEQTVYTPMFKFFQENDASVIKERIGMRDTEAGQIAASLVAGKSFDEIALIRRVGLGDATALDELQQKYASTFAQIVRYESAIDMVASSGNARVAYGFTRVDGSNIILGKQLPEATAILEAELKDIQGKYIGLNKALTLDSAMTERTVSKVDPLLNKLGLPGIENLRNDIAKQRAANKLGASEFDLTTRETAAGKVMQKVFADNGRLGALVRFIDRSIDDAPHQTINYNDAITSNTRTRSGMRQAADRKLIAPVEGQKLHNDFAMAKTETEKNAVIDKMNEAIMQGAAAKHGIPVAIADEVLKEYVYITKNNVNKAKLAKQENKAYMVDEAGDAVQDPQLISQLANGGYLVDSELVDKAFERYSKKMGEENSLPVNVAAFGRSIVGEFESIWRNVTLARTGFPVNVMRDSTLRSWGDGALFLMMKDLSSNAIKNITKVDNTVSEIRDWTKAVTNKDHNLKYITGQIEVHNAAIKNTEAALKRAKYDPIDPKTVTPEVQKVLDYQSKVQGIVNGLKKREQELLDGVTKKTVGRDTINVFGYEFPAGGAGQFGKMSYDKIRGKEELRGLLASSRELDMANIHRDRQGGHVIAPTQFNEKLHLKSWENVLNNTLINDPIAKKILAGEKEADIVSWIKSDKSGDYIDRFGYDSKLARGLKRSDAQYIYDRVLNTVNQFAPNSKLWKPLLEGKLDVVELKKLYPDWQSRPTIITDMAEDMLGQSNAARYLANMMKDTVTWLATVPTSRLSYNPYFNVKYEHKLQNMVGLANAQGRKLTLEDKAKFEATARAYALNEFKQKINAFNRDMNYPGIINHLMAFFPAVVEQYRAYGKLALEHPEFPARILSMSPTSAANIPDYIGNVQVDQFGDEYVEVTLPMLGIKGRLPASWFNAINPTGGHILSAGVLTAFTVNEVAKKVDLPQKFVDAVLPFGVQANAIGMLAPSDVRRLGQAYQAYFLKGGEQFNKDVNMFIEMKRQEFMHENHRNPNGDEVAKMYSSAKNDAVNLSLIRFAGSIVLPSQPRYVSPLQTWADKLSQYTKQYGKDGAEKFATDYPEYSLLIDKLSSNTSGIRSDITSMNLVKKNGDVVEQMIAQNPKFNLSALGAVFNDDDYAFSSAAQAYLTTHAIPGTKRKFSEQGEALQNATSSIVNQGWRDWNKMIEIVTQGLKSNNPPYTTGRGYGKAILDMYKKNFIEQAKTNNELWYKAKTSPSFADSTRDVIDSLTIAANTPKLWNDLAKQSRWHTVVDYLNFRYEIYDELKRRGTTIDTAKATDIREKVGLYVEKLRSQDTQFGAYYDRYFDGDSFTYVREE